MKRLLISTLSILVFTSQIGFASDLDALLNEISNLDSWAGNTGTTTTAQTHNAWETSIENISYTTDGKDLYTVTWTPLVSSANIKVEIKESKEADYFTLNTVKGSDGKIDIKLPTAGQYQIRLTAIDSSSNTAVSKEYIQTIKVDGVAPAPVPTTTATPTVTSTPEVKDTQTGPAGNVAIFTALMGLMLYGIYRFKKTS